MKKKRILFVLCGVITLVSGCDVVQDSEQNQQQPEKAGRA